MAKQRLEISKKEFQKVVDDLESKNTFKNTSELWKAIEETDWAKGLKPRPLTWAVAYQRAKELGIVTKAKPGKRGRQKGAVISGGGRKKGGRSKKMQFYQETFQGVRRSLPLIQSERFQKIVKKAAEGSLTAAIKLNCLDCSNYQPTEIKYCVIQNCSFYPHRPYKTNEEKEKMAKYNNGQAEPWHGYYKEIGDDKKDEDTEEILIDEDTDEDTDEDLDNEDIIDAA